MANVAASERFPPRRNSALLQQESRGRTGAIPETPLVTEAMNNTVLLQAQRSNRGTSRAAIGQVALLWPAPQTHKPRYGRTNEQPYSQLFSRLTPELSRTAKRFRLE